MVGNDVHVHNALSEDEAHAALYYLGKEIFLDRLLLSAGGHDVSDLYHLGKTWVAPHLPINGRDLLSHGLAQGPDVGAVLRTLEREWVQSGFQLSRDQLLKKADHGS